MAKKIASMKLKFEEHLDIEGNIPRRSEPNRVFDMRRQRFEDIDPRRMPELIDSMLLNEDHTAMANLPRRAQNHEFPKNYTPYFSFNNDVIGE